MFYSRLRVNALLLHYDLRDAARGLSQFVGPFLAGVIILNWGAPSCGNYHKGLGASSVEICALFSSALKY